MRLCDSESLLKSITASRTHKYCLTSARSGGVYVSGGDRVGSVRVGVLTALGTILVVATPAVQIFVAQFGVVHALLLRLTEKLTLGTVLGLGAGVTLLPS